MINKNLLILIISFLSIHVVEAQDPLFSQFYSSPMNVSPSLAGAGSTDWRVITNFRNQSIGGDFQSLTTTSLSFDGKIIKQKYRSSNYVGMGIMLLQDAGLGGAYRNNLIHLAASSHVSLDEQDNHGLCAGLGIIYNNTIIRPDMLDFPNQISYSGFNTSIPNLDQLSINNTNPHYYSVAAGVTYTFTSDKANFDIGISGFRFNRASRSILGDSKQEDPPRYNIHSDFQTYLNDRLVVNINALFVSQKNLDTYIVGANFGRLMSGDEVPTVINAGLWYKQNTSIIPYLGIMYKNMQAGITYDINIGNSTSSLIRTFELSLIFRKPGKTGRLMDSFGK